MSWEQLIREATRKAKLCEEIEQDSYLSKIQPSDRVHLLHFVDDIDDMVKEKSQEISGEVTCLFFYNGKTIRPTKYFLE